MKKRRKVKKGRLIIVAIVPILVISLLGMGVHHVLDKMEQKDRWEVVSSLQTKHNKVKKSINSMETSDYVTEEDFEALRDLAKEEDKKEFSYLESFKDPEARIEDEQFEKIEKLKNPSELKYHHLMTLVEDMEKEGHSYVQFVLTEPESRIDYALEFENQDEYLEPSKTIDKSLDTIPHLIQWDTKWGFVPYGDMRISFSGCAPTCLSMVFSYLKQDETITPAVLAEYSEDQGFYTNGQGTQHILLDSAAKEFDVQVEGVPVDKKSLTAALKKGKICIANVVPGDFTTIGHFIVLTGIKDGKLQVLDPNSKIRTAKQWDIQRVLDQTNTIWAYSE